MSYADVRQGRISKQGILGLLSPAGKKGMSQVVARNLDSCDINEFPGADGGGYAILPDVLSQFCEIITKEFCVAHSLSAKKRIRQSAKRRLRNRDRKKAIKIQVKKVSSLIVSKDAAGTQTAILEAIAMLDRYAAKGTLHRNTVARRKSALMKKLNAVKK